MEVNDVKILLVDDESDVLDFMKYNLEKEGFWVYTAQDGLEGLQLAKKINPDIIILDLMMPKLDGIETCRELRALPEFKNTIITFLTARDEDYSQIAGFEVGADDYITKPFSPRELTARIKAVIRRKMPEHAEMAMTAGPLELDPVSCRVFVQGNQVEIGHAEFKLLKFLIAHPERVFSRSQLLDKVWGDHVVLEERTVDVHILRLRKALGEAEFLIKTIRSVGYMLSEK
jgi:two-component system phosphate regulon response regulator PhoB